MKKLTLKTISLICLIPLLAACGKKDEPVVANQGVAAVPTCAAGQVYSAQYGCAAAQYGQPNGYNGTQQNWQPVNNVHVPQGGCQSGYYQYPYGGGYGQHGCQSQRNYRWYFNGNSYYFY